MTIKSMLAFFSVAVAATAYADIAEPEVLHRIGYEVLVAAAGAAVLGGGLLRKLRNKSKTDETAHWKDEYEVSPAERDDIKRRIDENLPFVQEVFDRAYERTLPTWMKEDKEKVTRHTFACLVGRARESAWSSLQEQLLMDVLAQDEALIERFRGVPIEWLRNRLAKPMPDDFTAGVFEEKVIDGRYRVVKQLVEGRMGNVYLCHDELCEIEVVAWTLPPCLKSNNDELKKFRQVILNVMYLIHPNIVSVLLCAQGNVDGYYVVEKYAPGLRLSQWCGQFPDGKVPLEKVVEIVRQIATALDYAHTHDVLHRGVEPSNVLIDTMVDGKLVARIRGFGLDAEIRCLMDRIGESSHMSGNCPYMSPEQRQGGRIGPRSDQYSLGVMAYEMIAGRLPQQNGGELSMHDIFVDKVPPINGVAAGVDKALARALAKNPDERFESCSEFVSVLNGEKRAKGLVGWWRSQWRQEK